MSINRWNQIFDELQKSLGRIPTAKEVQKVIADERAPFKTMNQIDKEQGIGCCGFGQ